jgi:hypothetical protein
MEEMFDSLTAYQLFILWLRIMEELKVSDHPAGMVMTEGLSVAFY